KTEKTLLTGSNLFFRKKVLTSRYSGNMIRGKFNGAVVTVDHGKTYHATFADGHRKGGWARGPAPAATEVASTEDQLRPGEKASDDVVIQTPSAEAAGKNAQRSTLNAERPIKEARESAETAAPAEGPEDSEDGGQKIEV